MEKVIRKLNKLKENGTIKDYAIGGAHAVAYYLEPVKTLDLDIFIFIDSDQAFYNLRAYIKKARLRGTHVIINDIPVHFIPGSLHPFINEAVKRGKKIRVSGIPTKVLTVEYLIISLLMAFRLKDKMVIPDLLELANMRELKIMVERFTDEETPLDQRLQRVLGNL